TGARQQRRRPPDGRAVRRARCAHTRAAAARAPADLDAYRRHRHLRDPLGRGGGATRRPRAGDERRTGPHRERHGHRPAAAPPCRGGAMSPRPSSMPCAATPRAASPVILRRGVPSKLPRVDMTDRRPQAAIYRGMDRAALDAAYNNSAAVADSQDWLARWRRRSAEVRASSGARLDLAYGPRPRARLDYLPCGNKHAPLFVFIHGGYWQRNEKETFAFVADGPRARGIDVAVPGYTLAPQARLTDIVEEIRQALTFLSDNAGDLGFDRHAIFVGGWSAGGHLTAAVADHPSFRGGMPISGIFDLEPIALNYLNELLS